MKLLRVSRFALAALLGGCGGPSPMLGNLSGTWACPTSDASCLHWTSVPAFLGVSSGSTSLTAVVSQADGGSAVTFTGKPTEGNGVTWTCPAGTLDGAALSFGECTLRSGGSCTTTVTPAITLSAASGASPMRMAWAGYHYTWAGSGCVGKDITVTVDPFELRLQ